MPGTERSEAAGHAAGPASRPDLEGGASVPRFLTSEWVEAFNRALADVVLPAADEDAGSAARSGRFTVAQRVEGAPQGEVTLLLSVEDGRIRLSLRPEPDEADGGRADVSIVLGYADAVALSRGDLSPAEALTEGRVRVRGDLAVLMAGQQALAEARRHTASLAADTTY